MQGHLFFIECDVSSVKVEINEEENLVLFDIGVDIFLDCEGLKSFEECM